MGKRITGQKKEGEGEEARLLTAGHGGKARHRLRRFQGEAQTSPVQIQPHVRAPYLYPMIRQTGSTHGITPSQEIVQTGCGVYTSVLLLERSAKTRTGSISGALL
jgi:hypothetical protein